MIDRALLAEFESASVPADDGGRWWDDWPTYPFNFNGDPKRPPWREVNRTGPARFGFTRLDHLILYMIKQEAIDPLDRDSIRHDEPLIILALSTTNSAHSMSEMLSFVAWYKAIGSPYKVGVNSILGERLPFVTKLFREFIPADKIVDLDASRHHVAPALWIRRNLHMNSIVAWDQVPYDRQGDLLVFPSLEGVVNMFHESPKICMDMATRILERWSKTNEPADVVMLLKTSSDSSSTTPGRAMEMSPDIKMRFMAAGIKVVSIDDFATLDDYIGTIRGAKTFVTSYGGPACTNRLFCAPDARVIVLANEAYRWEYEYPVESGEYWHIRHSHLFTAAKQAFILDHPNVMTNVEADRLLALIASTAW